MDVDARSAGDMNNPRLRVEVLLPVGVAACIHTYTSVAATKHSKQPDPENVKSVPQVTQYCPCRTSSTVAMVPTSIPATYLGAVQWNRDDHHRNGVCAVGGVKKKAHYI